jgi:hypothetical protein
MNWINSSCQSTLTGQFFGEVSVKLSDFKKHMVDIPILDTQGLRRFGLTFGGIIGVLFGLLVPWVFGLSLPYWPWVVLLFFISWSLLAPDSLSGFYTVWMRFGLILNAVMSRIILGIVFYLVVLPIGILMRFSGRDPMNRKFDGKLDSYRVKSDPKDKFRMEKPF